MAPNANVAATSSQTLVCNELLRAASTVLGALEVIGEAACDDVTERDIARASAGASVCMSELGLTDDSAPGRGTIGMTAASGAVVLLRDRRRRRT